MRTDTPPQMRLADYRPYPFAVEHVHLDFALDPKHTIVKARMEIRRTGAADAGLELDGEALELVSIAIDGTSLSEDEYEVGEHSLTIASVPDSFTLETEVRISPETNTALSGLYMSGGRFCTQCEAEGFRRITYWPDRPDVMSRFFVRMHAEKAKFPILLSNGSPVANGDMEGGRHFAEWDDPHPKPSYLFALCAGDYDVYRDDFTTMEGRKVQLAIHVDKGDGARAAYAMDSLKRSMKWDEDVFKRAYDLDVFNIVAVRDFNFGAMENKGLNVFNSAYVLADADTATDADFEAIESIVAHEYFHNWTGNRITCRDWFQLCLKEGLTVFRDQEFSADMRSRPVQRIKDVLRLRARQFPEDAGPLAHAVRPDTLASIDNLYTATVYEKGSELIRMLRALIGEDAFAKGMQLYFERHDGEAVTIEDFYACFAETSGRDMDDFLVWYSQPGTPHVGVEATRNEDHLTLKLTQVTAPTPSQSTKTSLPIPLRLSILDADTGAETLTESDAVLSGATLDLEFELPAGHGPALVSFNRGFAAPIRVEQSLSLADRIRLVEIETDPFNQWDGAQSLLRDSILAIADKGGQAEPDGELIGAVVAAVERRLSDPSLAALMLRVPMVSELFMERNPADPAALDAARRAVKAAIASRFANTAREIISKAAPAPFEPSAEQAGIRALRGACMSALAHNADGADLPLVKQAFDAASNMTESLAALSALCDIGGLEADAALADFYKRWSGRPTVLDKWFSVQAMSGGADAVETVRELVSHRDFDLKNPNRVRSVLASFSMNNLPAFHRPDGAGHAVMADMVREIDALNPALSARLLTAFEQWKRLEPKAKASARKTLESLDAAKLSRNAADIVSRALG